MGAIWGPPLGVTLLVLAGVFSAVAIMGLVGSVAKTPEGAGNLASIVAVILGMLGGTFFPVGQGDDLLSKLTYLTPHAWFLRGLANISGGAEWTAALPAVAALLDIRTGHRQHRLGRTASEDHRMKVFAIAWNNVRRMLRERSNIFFVFIFPLALILLIGAQFGGGVDPVVGLYLADDGRLAAAVADASRSRGHPRRHPVRK